MKKKIALFAAALLAFLALTGCKGSVSDTDYGISNLPLGMYLSIKQIKGGVVTLEINNQSGYEMTYDGCFTLEVEKDGQWQVIHMQEGIAIEEVVCTIPDLQKDEVAVDLNAIYGKLEAGHYRLSQDDMQVEFDL